jgi:catechol 2,3-dioxygenase-like lactoylglutathione lyase family enzyme
MTPETIRRRSSSLARAAALLLPLLLPLSSGPAAATPSVAAGPSWSRPVDAAAARARSVDTITIVVADLERSVAFYRDVLDFEARGRDEIGGDGDERLLAVFGARALRARLALGQEEIELVQFLAPTGRGVPPEQRSNDRSFQHLALVVADMAAAHERLRAHDVAESSAGPQRLPDWNPSAGGIEAFYFRDPDGHPLELIRFPPGKGRARWQEPSGRLFLGIDHTAIVVADTKASLAFWRDALGLVVAGESENHGPEQERLNAVFGARLRITGLSAGQGPGVELLEYLSPRDGRPAPGDLAANDLVATQTVVAVGDADEAAARLLQHGFSWVSPGAVAGSSPLGGRRAALVRDPDGHLVRLFEKE